jgi:hypothetical protein
MPVVVVRGARQTSKTTLVRSTPTLVGHWYVTLDDLDVRLQAEADPETVALVTSLPSAELDAAQWLAASRAACGIETGLHQRLDFPIATTRAGCAGPRRCAAWACSGAAATACSWNSAAWQNKPPHQATTDFFGTMNAEHHRDSSRCRHARHPSLQTASWFGRSRTGPGGLTAC